MPALDSLIPIANDLLTQFGQVVTITTPGGGGTFDPATDTTSGASPATTQQGTGIEENYSNYSLGQGVVLAGDVKFLLSPLRTDGAAMVIPVADRDTLTKGDGVWAIKRVDTLGPAGAPVLFELQLRRA